MSQDHNHLNHATWECKYTPKYRKGARLSATFGDDPRVAILSALSGNGRCRGAFASCRGGTHPNITLFIRVNISGIAPGMDQLHDRICFSRKEAVHQMRSWDRPRGDATIAVERRPYSCKRERRLIAVAFAIKLTSPGPALFFQYRYGYRNRRFGIYKFRSMRVDAGDRTGSGRRSEVIRESHGLEGS